MAVVLPPLVDHIAAIKRRVLLIAATVSAWFVLTFAYATELIDWFRRPLTDDLMFYGRSEEHTSELQSQSNLVCRLLLDKKNRLTCSPLLRRLVAYAESDH